MLIIWIILLFVTLLMCSGIELIWIPNREGLFSHFLQLRILKQITTELNYTKLVITSLTTIHFNNTEINLCNIFNLPDSIECRRDVHVNNTLCARYSKAIRRAYYLNHYPFRHLLLQSKVSKELSPCYKFSLPFMGGETRRDAFLRAVSFHHPALLFQPEFYTIFHKFRANMFQAMNIFNTNTSVRNYTVVHWRRGDQLTSRCQQGKDVSVNCRSARRFVHEVRQYTNDSLVYVATNEEDLHSVDMSILHEAGFLTLNESLLGYHRNSVQAAVVDVLLMLDATTFLSWGVSVINDAVEHERMLQGSTYCVVCESDVVYPTWCWLQEQYLLQYQSKQPYIPLSNTTTSTDVLHRHEERMQHAPLVLSHYNISTMPAYLDEIAVETKRMARELNTTAARAVLELLNIYNK